MVTNKKGLLLIVQVLSSSERTQKRESSTLSLWSLLRCFVERSIHSWISTDKTGCANGPWVLVEVFQCPLTTTTTTRPIITFPHVGRSVLYSRHIPPAQPPMRRGKGRKDHSRVPHSSHFDSICALLHFSKVWGVIPNKEGSGTFLHCWLGGQETMCVPPSSKGESPYP